MELRQIQYFIAIAELEHFGRASQRLRIAQPALSRQMRLLEAELGLSLFERLPRGVRLTEAGRVFLERARLVMQQLDHAVLEAKAAAAGHAGVLRLGVIEVAAWQGLVPDAIRRFRADHPAAQLVLAALSGAEQVEAIEAQQLDAGLMYNPAPDAGLEATPLARHPVMLAVNVNSPLAGREAVRLADLADEDLLGFRRRESPQYYDDLQAAFRRAGFTPRLTAETRREADLLALVSAGAGVALVNSCQRFRPPQEVRFVPVSDLDVGLTLAYVRRRGHSLPLIDRFAETLEALRAG
ncbi:LysR family transcriptional regulator [Paracoccus sp. S-4012]|uniref:LysR family transcriptional regulator n=1 Tax=Paracoccus sp. S-4012 TaxID=2665648 RepID=UPI0012B05DCA|nr:LysR family transcriptional regulator [Paracoccus sp. S-4012]MRX51745.1 LysR family transcriptional regulator [Paracoccus sp. S-4012]